MCVRCVPVPAVFGMRFNEDDSCLQQTKILSVPNQKFIIRRGSNQQREDREKRKRERERDIMHIGKKPHTFLADECFIVQRRNHVIDDENYMMIFQCT